MRSLVTALSLAALFVSANAFAQRTSKQAGWVAKDAFQKQTGGKLDRTREVYSSQRAGGEVVLGWKGPARGPGARGAYLMVVPSGSRGQMVRGTKISKDLERAGADLVSKHLAKNGLPAGKIQYGDHVTTGRGGELLQRPVSRDSGYLRYTVTEASGTQHRYLVTTNPTALVKGGRVLGKVFMDTDTYGQKPQK